MALSQAQVTHLWRELEALGPAFIIDKAHDFGGDRTGKLDEPPQIPITGERAKKSFLAGFCKQLCKAFLPRTSNGRIIQDPNKWTKQVWADQKTVYYTVKVYTLLWASVKMHSIDPFFQNGDRKNLYLQSYAKMGTAIWRNIVQGKDIRRRRPKCQFPSQARLFKNDFFKSESASKNMRDESVRAATSWTPASNPRPCRGTRTVPRPNIDGRARDGRTITFKVGTSDVVGKNAQGGNSIEGKLVRGRNTDNVLGGNYNVVSDSPITNQDRFMDRLSRRGGLKAGTSSFLDAAPSNAGEQKVFGITYNMPFLAAKNGGIKYYINLHVENNDGTGELNATFGGARYYVLKFGLYQSGADNNWGLAGVAEQVLNIKAEDEGIFPGDVGFLGCVINTLVNRERGSRRTHEAYQWDNINTIINSLKTPVSVIQRLIVKETIMAAFVYVAKIFADHIYGDTSSKVKFVIAFIMQTKTMGDFSSLKDCEWMEQNLPGNPKCFVSTTDIFLRKLVSAFYTSERGSRYFPKVFGGKSLNDRGVVTNPNAFSRRSAANPQIGGVLPDQLDTALSQTEGAGEYCRQIQGIFTCDEEYGQVSADGMANAETALEMNNIWNNILDFQYPAARVRAGAAVVAGLTNPGGAAFNIVPETIITRNANIQSKWVQNIQPDDVWNIHSGMFGPYLMPTPLHPPPQLREAAIRRYPNIWNISRKKPIAEWRQMRMTQGALTQYQQRFYVSLNEAFGLNNANDALAFSQMLKGELSGAPNRYLNHCVDTMMAGPARAQNNFNNSINYLFIRAWRWRLNAIRNCDDYDEIDHYAAHQNNPMAAMDDKSQMYERCMFNTFNPERWFNFYFNENAVQDQGFNQIRAAGPTPQQVPQGQGQQQAQGAQGAQGAQVRRRTSARIRSRTPGRGQGGGKSKKRRRKKKKTRRKNKRRKKTKRRRKRRKKTRRR